MEIINNIFKRFSQVILQCLYKVNPNSTKFGDIEEVPHYYAEAIPVFLSLIILERLVLGIQGKKLPGINDGLTSLACGIFNEIGRIFFNGVETFLYLHIYNNYRIFELPWESTLTWILAAIGVDFCFYWVHRAAHEVNLIWSQHQVHHSSEEFNLTTGFRESLFEGWFGSLFYLPMAFFVPPSVFVVHLEFNFMFQFWIHTELIENLGPFELIFNTPSHHRVHHAANKYCIDKNYGGFLIIWDRLFGTFAAEKKEQKLIYGLIDPVKSFNPLYLQFFYWNKILEKMESVQGFGQKVSAFFKGPGWTPGSPRTGYEHLLPDIRNRAKLQHPISRAMQFFQVVHFVLLFGIYQMVSTDKIETTTTRCLLGFYVLFSLTSMGMVHDNSNWAPYAEFARSISILCYSFVQPTIFQIILFSLNLYVLQLFYSVTTLFWLGRILKKTKHKGE